jgi:hypothetical protein
MPAVNGPQSCASAPDAICYIGIPNDAGITTNDGQRFLGLTGCGQGKAAKQYGAVETNIALKPGTTYELSFEIGSSSAVPVIDQLGVEVNVAGAIDPVSHEPVSQRYQEPAPLTLGQWESHSLQFTTLPDAGGNVTLHFGGYVVPGHRGGNYVGLDQVSVRQVCSFIEALLRNCDI